MPKGEHYLIQDITSISTQIVDSLSKVMQIIK